MIHARLHSRYRTVPFVGSVVVDNHARSRQSSPTGGECEGHPLLEKWKRKTCTEQETLRMYVLVAQDEIYDRFEKRIRPSVERAVRVRDAQLAQRRLTPTTLPA